MNFQIRRAVNTAAFVTALFFMGCKVYRPEMPLESYKYQPQKPKTSVINLFADLETAKLESLVNSHIDSVLYDDNSFEDNDGDYLMMKAWKDGQVSLSFEKDKLVWELPLRIWMRKGLKVFKYKVPFVDSWEYSGNIKLRFKTTLSVLHDWNVRTATVTDGYEWIKSPSVHIGSANIPIKLIANILVSANRETISRQIDQTITGSFNFRKIAEEGWKLLFNPFKLQGDYNAWLSINPYSVSMMPVEGSSGRIRLGAGVVSDMECLVDNVPQSGQVRSLPDLQSLETLSDTFHISLLTDIPYTSIDRIMNEEAGDSTFTFGNRKITFESFRVYGSNGKLVVETKIRGSLNGIVYLTGTPYFNVSDTTVRIKDLAFDIKTMNLMMNSAKWFFNGKIERTLMKSIAIPFSEDIAGIENQLAGFLSHYKLGYGFEINGKLTKLSVADIALAPGSVKANLVFSGNLAFGFSDSNLENEAN